MNRHASMNRVYRLIWSQVRSTWIPVAETARGRGKSGRANTIANRNVLAAAISLALSPLAYASPPAPSCVAPACASAVSATSHPLGAQVVSGTASITQSGNTTDVRQSSPDVSIDWLSFNVGAQASVDFIQPSASAIAVNRISGTNGSEILGHLDANGQVYLINPNGIVFGQGAEVNVGGLVASTLNANPSASTGSTQSFAGTGTGSIVNQGAITASAGGYVVLVGNRVSNQGDITAQLGTVALGAGSAVTLDFSGNRLVHLQVDQSTLNNLAANHQLIQADGGLVIMTAGAQRALLASVVNNTGIIEARTVENHSGTIELLGGMTAGTVTVGGTLDASAPDGGNGGFIETNAAHVEVADGTQVTTAASRGVTGTWLIDPTDFTVAPTGGDITGATLSSDLNSTNFTILSSTGTSPVTGGGSGGNINVNDTVAWSANTTLTLTAANNVNVNGSITASGATAALAINPNTTNGTETASGTGTLNLGAGASITLSGATAALSIATSSYSLGAGATINLPNVSPTSTTALVIGGTSYTVINSVGAAGSITGTDLQGIEGNLSGVYALGSNINASGTSAWNAGAGFAPIGTQAKPFLGTFDGLGHSISNLTVDRPATDFVGLFGFVGSNTVASVIGNVGLVGGSVSGNYGVGDLAGASYGTISNSYATGRVTGASFQVGGLVGIIESGGVLSNSYATGNVSSAMFIVGGLVGANYGSVTSSYATGSVSGTGNVGGLVGSNYGTLSNSHATGGVSSSGNSAGGLVGYNNGGAISDSYAKGNVTGTSTGNFIGGLVGQNGGSSTVNGSYATGKVTGSANDIGGLVGINNGDATISSSYATGKVSGANYVGGLVGNNDNTGTVSSSYATGTVSGTGSYIGGLVGRNYGSISSSYAAGNVSSNNYAVGGLVGQNGLEGTNYGTVSNSYATGTVSGSARGIGGLAGLNYGTISNSHATGRVTNGTSTSNSWSGGLVGYNYGTITSSYATGNISGSDYSAGGLVGYDGGSAQISTSYATGSVTGTSTGDFIGGLVGYHTEGTISNSYATGNVSGASYVGGLAGENSGTVSYSYATGKVSGTGTNVGGLVGATLAPGSVVYSFWNTKTSGQTTSAGGTGMTTSQMQTQANFTSATNANGNVDPGWDFSGTWVMYNGHTYPLLRAFMTPITLTPVYNGTAQTLSNIANPITADIIDTSAGLTLKSSATAGKETAELNGFFSNQQGYIISYAKQTITGTGSAANGLTIANPITWGAGKLTLDAVGSIEINADLDATGTASLAAIATGGVITQAASTAIDVAGATSLTADNGVSGAGDVKYDITLSRAGDIFGGAVTADGSAITLKDATALTAILDSSGKTSLTAAGSLNVSGTVGTTLTTVTTGGTGSTTTFGKTTVGTSLDVTSTGAVTETSANILTVAGADTTTVPNPKVCVNGTCDVEIPAP